MAAYVRAGLRCALIVADRTCAELIIRLDSCRARQEDIPGRAVIAGSAHMLGQSRYVMADAANLVINKSAWNTAQRLLCKNIINMLCMSIGSRRPLMTRAATAINRMITMLGYGRKSCSCAVNVIVAIDTGSSRLAGMRCRCRREPMAEVAAGRYSTPGCGQIIALVRTVAVTVGRSAARKSGALGLVLRIAQVASGGIVNIDIAVKMIRISRAALHGCAVAVSTNCIGRKHCTDAAEMLRM